MMANESSALFHTAHWMPQQVTLRRKRTIAERTGRYITFVIIVTWIMGLAVGFERSLSVGTAIGFGFAVLGLRSPFFALVGIGLLCSLDAPMRFYLMKGGLLRWNTLNYWLIVVMAMYLPTLLKRKDLHSRLLSLFVLALVIGIGFSASPMSGVMTVLAVVTQFGLLIYCLRAAKDETNWYWFSVIVGLCSGLGAIVFYFQMSGLEEIDKNAMSYMPLCGLFSVCMGFPFVAKQKRRQTVLGTIATINLCAVFLSESRGSLLVAMICIMFLLWNIKNFTRVFTILCVAGLLGILLLSQFSEKRDRSLERASGLFDSDRTWADRTNGRSALAMGTLVTLLDNPLGVGSGGFAKQWAMVSREHSLGFREGKEKISHSAWLKVTGELGFPGLFIFGGYITSFAFVGYKRRRQGLLPIGLLVTGVLAIAFVSTEFNARSLWLMSAYGTTMLQRRKRHPLAL